jgi:hypothetical protein
MSRIRQIQVPALFPKVGPASLLIFGEAPGPRGADQSGIPFWGDAAGLPIYRTLVKAGRAIVSEEAFSHWDGQALKSLGLVPELTGVALSNAYPRCPTRDGQRFHAPTDKQLLESLNLERIRWEIGQCGGGAPLCVLALGRRAQWLLERLDPAPPWRLAALPHPSAQGLLQAAPGRGKGMRLEDLRLDWERSLLEHVRENPVTAS